jgi:citronellol/citronellal dehydrogenase
MSTLPITLKDKTLFITGASRGIGLEIAKKAAADGANIVVVGKSDQPDPRLPGTIHSAVTEIEQAGGKALAIQCDIRFEDQIVAAIAAAVQHFGGIDVLINNASALDPSPIGTMEAKRFDLITSINYRGTYLCCKHALPHLLNAANPHILTLSPPLNLNPKWFGEHLAYTISKYNMSFVTMGLAHSLLGKVAVNSLWPESPIDTAAIRMLEKLQGIELVKHSRKPAIVADAAHWILTQPQYTMTGNFFTDVAVLAMAGVTDLSAYAVDPSETIMRDYFLD